MSTSTLHPVATAYLQQVRREGRDLPRDRLAELLIDLEEHLSAAIPADASEEDAREVLVGNLTLCRHAGRLTAV